MLIEEEKSCMCKFMKKCPLELEINSKNITLYMAKQCLYKLPVTVVLKLSWHILHEASPIKFFISLKPDEFKK